MKNKDLSIVGCWQMINCVNYSHQVIRNNLPNNIEEVNTCVWFFSKEILSVILNGNWSGFFVLLCTDNVLFLYQPLNYLYWPFQSFLDSDSWFTIVWGKSSNFLENTNTFFPHVCHFVYLRFLLENLLAFLFST
jgi:hypothetical protein